MDSAIPELEGAGVGAAGGSGGGTVSSGGPRASGEPRRGVSTVPRKPLGFGSKDGLDDTQTLSCDR